MIVGTRNRRSAYHELIRKRPPRFLLKDIERPSNGCFSPFLNDTYRVFFYLTRETEENSTDKQQDCVWRPISTRLIHYSTTSNAIDASVGANCIKYHTI